MSLRHLCGLLAAAALLLDGPVARAGEAEILTELRAFFATEDAAQQAQIVARIQADPAYDRTRVGGWLTRAGLQPALAPGRSELKVAVGFGQSRSVTLRLPRGYTRDSAWPLVYALHPSGGDGPGFLDALVSVLGAQADEFVIAAPTNYRQTGLDAPAPFTVDHRAILRAVRAQVNVDAGRQYAIGFSLGGYATWAVACLHADELAGAAPLASIFCIPPTEDGLWREMLPALAHLPVLNVWGAQDTLGVYSIEGAPIGGIGELNRRLVQWSAGLAPTLEHVEAPGRSHRDTPFPLERLRALLARRRQSLPRQVETRFRHLHQAHAYWLEALAWQGERWDAGLPKVRKQSGENREQALGRELRERLGQLAGRIEGQSIHVTTRHVGELVVWLGDGMLDWAQPVALDVDGRQVWSGPITPDLLVCLREAARSRDFERLRWAGLRIGSAGQATRVDATTRFPPLVPER